MNPDGMNKCEFDMLFLEQVRIEKTGIGQNDKTYSNDHLCKKGRNFKTNFEYFISKT